MRLTAIKGSLEGRDFSLVELAEKASDTGGVILLGRDPQACAIVLEDHGVSRTHARMRYADGIATVEDLGSRNGVQINGKVIEKKTALREGDVVRIGAAAFRFRESEVSQAPGAPSEDDAQSRSHAQGIAPPSHTAASDFSREDLEVIEKVKAARVAIEAEMGKVIVGQRAVIEQLLVCLFARGHVLLEGVPGLAKTLMVHTLADILELTFKRIQFTPDLMPSDITGTDILEEDHETKRRQFKFIRGPIFTNVLLADEINRTPPKTQAALLEAMQEYRVTAAGVTYELDLPFFVLATQNPLEQEGTYPLPEAQLDRFMFKVAIDYPSREEEIAIVDATTVDKKPKLDHVLSSADILALQNLLRKVPVSRHVVTYATDLVRATRPGSPEAPPWVAGWLNWGAGPRAAQYLVLGAKARAMLNGRANVSADDVRATAAPVLRHRMFCNFNAASEGVSTEDVIRRLIRDVPEPGPDGAPGTAAPKARSKPATRDDHNGSKKSDEKEPAAKSAT